MNAKYTITSRPSIIRYTPNALKSFFLIYPSKNLIATIDTRKDTTIPTISTINCVVVNARPNFTIFNKLAPNITGIPKKMRIRQQPFWNTRVRFLQGSLLLISMYLELMLIPETHQFPMPFHKIIL